MKKVFIFVALMGVVALTSCGENGNNNAKESGRTVDSIANQATNAASNALHSATEAVENAADSVKAAADSLRDGK